MDDKLLERVRKLLRKAEGAGTEAEAEAFTAKANELMLKYSINEAMLQRKGEHTSEKVIAKTVTVEGYAKAKLDLLREVARGVGCDAAFYSNKRQGWSTGMAEVVGWESDMQAFEVLFASLLMQASAECDREFRRVTREYPKLRGVYLNWRTAYSQMEHELYQAEARADASRAFCPACGERVRAGAWYYRHETQMECSFCKHTWQPIDYPNRYELRKAWNAENPMPENPGEKPPHGRSFRQSFLIGYARVVGARLYKQRQRTVAEVDEEQPGTALAVVDRDRAVQKFTEHRWVKGGGRRGASTSSNAGYYSGREAASRANLGQSSVGGGRKAIGR